MAAPVDVGRVFRPIRVVPLPSTSPPILAGALPVEVTRPTSSRYVQQTLAMDFDLDVEVEPRVTGTAALPDPLESAARLAQAAVEIVEGTRPATQLIRHTSQEVYAVLARRAFIAARRSAQPPTRRPVVRRVRVTHPADGVVEACAVIVHADRARALALRLEGLDGRWVVTALALG